MPEKILDLHIHSRYSRACSKSLMLPAIAQACERIGIDIVSTADFTHPAWFSHMKEELEEENAGIFRLTGERSKTRFIIGTEISCIKKHAGATRRVHHLIFVPSFASAEKCIQTLEARGCNLRADGRPIVGLTSKELLEILLSIDPRAMLVPAHAWTPWFGIFGSHGGYDSLEEAFGDLTPHVRAIETGLSSDPAMNWRVSALDRITMISNSDAHSVAKLGREANVMSFDREEDLTYDEIIRIISEGDAKHFLHTIEFYPEEGKYHADGHADCKFSCTPAETKKYGGRCPVCHRTVTIGVLSRVDALADRNDADAKNVKKIPFRSVVPLAEIIAEALHVGVASMSVKKIYDGLIKKIGTEFFILLSAEKRAIATASSAHIAEAITRMRDGRVTRVSGYDGVYGKIRIFSEDERKKMISQPSLFA